MRLIHDLKYNENKLIGDILYKKNNFTTEGFQYYNERYIRKQCLRHGSWERYRDLLAYFLPQKYPKSDFWIKVIEMQYRGYIYQTIASNIHEDIYEVIGIKENREYNHGNSILF